MNLIVILNIVMEKELELERQGISRTRRWIGDASQSANPGWYQTRVSQVSRTNHNLDGIIQAPETKPRQDVHRSILTRFFNSLYTNRQPAQSKV